MDIQEELKKIKTLPNSLQDLDQGKSLNVAPLPSIQKNTNELNTEDVDFLSSNSLLGRPSLPEEEKAKPITIRLHQHHIEKLDFVPGEGHAEKVRYLIDTVTELKAREKKQFKTLDNQIERCYRLAIMIHKPEEFNFDEAKRNKLKKQFLEEFKGMEAMVNLLGFSYGDLKRGLDKTRATDIDIIFMVKEYVISR
ncbi:MAG: hypothetical protein Fur0010_28900 [Bdellovibrio sp.]